MPKRVEYRGSQDDPRVYGVNMKDGGLDKAAGPLVKALHSKCFWVIQKREIRGRDAVQGTTRVGAYDEDEPEDQAERIRKARETDPGYHEPVESDWRDQEVHEVGEFQ